MDNRPTLPPNLMYSYRGMIVLTEEAEARIRRINIERCRKAIPRRRR